MLHGTRKLSLLLNIRCMSSDNNLQIVLPKIKRKRVLIMSSIPNVYLQQQQQRKFVLTYSKRK